MPHRRLVLVPLTLIAVTACKELIALPFDVSFDVHVPALTESDVSADDRGWRWMQATDVQDLDALREQQPKAAQLVGDVRALDVTIGSPALGPIGTWVDGVDVYVSEDGELSADDLLVGSLTDIPPDLDTLVVPVPDEAQPYLQGHTLALIFDVHFVELPPGELDMPTMIHAEGLVDPF